MRWTYFWIRLVKQLLQSSNAEENQQKVIQERLESTPKSKKQKTPCEQRLQSKIVSPFPSIKRAKRYKRIQPGSLLSELLDYQAPEVNGLRYSIYQLVTLLKVDEESPVYKKEVKNCLNLLAEKDKCVVNLNTLYCYIKSFEEQNIMPPEGIEGTRR